MHALVLLDQSSARNLKCLVSPVTNIMLAGKIVNTGHVTLTTPLLGVVCHRRLAFYSLPACKKLDYSIFSRSRNITGSIATMSLLFPNI